MRPYNQNQIYPVNQGTTLPMSGIAAAGLVGAVVTGTIAAARDIRMVKDGTKERSQAVTGIAKEALGGGIALAAGAAVAKTVFRTSPLGMVAMMAVGIGTKYAYDSFVRKAECKDSVCNTTETKPAKSSKPVVKN